MNRLVFLALLLLAPACAAERESLDSTSSSETSAAGSSRPGMGATVFDGGTLFRVFAPNASRVFVAGEFNGWSMTRDEMHADGNGNFTTEIAGAVAGQRYKYVVHHGSDVFWKADPRAALIAGPNDDSVIVDHRAFQWSAGSFVPPPVEEQIVYEMHLGTLNGASGQGTWRSALEKLDYLANLGVNMLEVMPPAEFPGDVSWGYNPVYPFAPERVYGAPDDAKAFIDGAHARGMGVIIDLVHNHYGNVDSNIELDMYCFDGDCLGAGGSYFYTGGWARSPWGWRPDFSRQQVRDYIVDNAMMWLRDYRADGLRWDATFAIRAIDGTDIPEGWDLLRRVNDAAKSEASPKLMIAEDNQDSDWVTKPTQVSGLGFDTQWDNRSYHLLHDAIVAGADHDRDMNRVRDAIAHGYNGVGTQRVFFSENHDEVGNLNGNFRLPNRISPNDPAGLAARKLSTLAAAIVLTAPGIPMLFHGQEFLEDGRWGDRALDFSKVDRFPGIVALYRDLIALRLAPDARGLRGSGLNFFHVNSDAKVIAFHRWQDGGAGDDVVVVANFSAAAFTSYEIGLPRGGAWKTRFNGDSARYSPDFGDSPTSDVAARSGGFAASRDQLEFSGAVALGPYSVVVLTQ
jgi:1,4-alpha-glucan branching enzyme